jgi:molybdopterin/thiamine biosynthesis adenylyltransferase
MADLTPEQLDRYARHVILDGVGAEGQERLLDGSALVVGAGGLGSPVIAYLAAAGVGRLTIADGDVVERSNLQRQVLHRDDDRGLNKAESAAGYVRARNPDVSIDTLAEMLGPDRVSDLVAEHDVVVDCSDNFPTRFLLNDACILEDTPLVHGAIYRFEGQALTLPGGNDPCYRCLFEEAPPPGTIPDCAEAGVLGALPGMIGSVQAIETLKLLIDIGDALAGRLLVFDALGLSFETVPIQRNPSCPACGQDADLTALDQVQYQGSCSLG